MIHQGKAPVREIVVHCTATRPEWWAGKTTTAKVAEIKRWHVQDRGWKDIGYHFLIDRDGTIAKGRAVTTIGAHVAGHNTGTIGISLFGGHGASADDQFSDHFTPAQDAALRKLLADIGTQTQVQKITGHNQYANKGCPGFNVPAWLDRRSLQPLDHVPAPSAPATPASPSAPRKTGVAAILALILRLLGKK